MGSMPGLGRDGMETMVGDDVDEGRYWVPESPRRAHQTEALDVPLFFPPQFNMGAGFKFRERTDVAGSHWPYGVDANPKDSKTASELTITSSRPNAAVIQGLL